MVFPWWIQERGLLRRNPLWLKQWITWWTCYESRGARLTSGQSGFPHSWNVAEKTWGKGRIYVDLSKNSKIQRTHNFIPAWGFFWSLQMDGIENSFFLAQKMESPKCCLSLWVDGQFQQRPVLIFPGLLDSCWDAAYHVKSLISLGTFDICKVMELLAKSMHSS